VHRGAGLAASRAELKEHANKLSADGCCAVLGGTGGVLAASSLCTRHKMASASSKAVQGRGGLGLPSSLGKAELLFSLGICAWCWTVPQAMPTPFRN